MTDGIRAGQVWRVLGSTRLALVVFTMPDDGHGDDVRVLPVFSGPVWPAMATERDVRVPAQEYSKGEDLLVNCWNSQVISGDDLDTHIGDVTAVALEACRAIEMVGLIPDEAARFADWVGQPLEVSDTARVEARRYFVDVWDDLRSRLALFRDAYQLQVTGSRVAVSKLAIGKNALTTTSGWFSLSLTGLPSADMIVSHVDLPALDYDDVLGHAA
jgi:hypothetical protein